VELRDAIGRRRMVRSFTDAPVESASVEDLCDLARRAPSAGNSQGTSFLVLAAPEARDRYWDLTLPHPKRSSFRWQGLLHAPVLVVVAVAPDAYVARYREPDKVATGLGASAEAWPVPYWWVDAGAAIEHLLLGVTEAGLGACLFGLFDHEASVAEALGVPAGVRLVATIAVGHPDPNDRPGRSVDRPRRPIAEVIHRDRWGS
jgi:nitroreductase